MNSLYYEMFVKPQEKYNKARKDVFEAAKSVHKAMESLSDLTPQQRNNLLRELTCYGMGMQTANWINQNYERRW